jgi:methylenetetrahydrofolate dehydrogenase (NADP+)/methenyltetrahydrofolate cyclohydrolase
MFYDKKRNSVDTKNMSNKNPQKAIILDGKKLADEMLLSVRKKIVESKHAPGLATILVGDDPASQLYVQLKEKAAEKVGINFSKYLCNSQCYSDIDERELMELIEFLNRDPMINAILLQLPLPKGFNADKIVKLISPPKDADGFNGGKVIPPTVAAVFELLRATGENLSNKKTLIIGKSDIFTKNIKKYLTQELTIKKSKIESSVPSDSNSYNIIIIALGQAGALKKKDVKPGAIIIDVGINKIKEKTVGDADPKVAEVAGWISPVPGGVGPLTVACLMRNVWELAKSHPKKQ